MHAQAFRLLRYAAGALCTLRTVLLPATATALASPHADAEAQKHHIQPTSGDLSPHVLEALQAACFADAQYLLHGRLSPHALEALQAACFADAQ
eukprot:1161072-Pelagomonas_calceolata.AAC.2